MSETRQQIQQLKQNLAPAATGLLKSFSEQEIELLSKELVHILKKNYPTNKVEKESLQEIMVRNFHYCVSRVGGSMKLELSQIEIEADVKKSFELICQIFDRYYHLDTTTCYQDFIGRSIEEICEYFKKENGGNVPFDLKYTTTKKKMKKKMNQSLEPFVATTYQTVSKQFIHKISFETEKKKQKKKISR